MELLITKFFKSLVLPPGLMLLMLFVGLWIRKRFHRTGQTLIIGSIALLIILSMPIVSDLLVQWQEDIPPYDISQIDAANPDSIKPGAIVVLGAGRYPDAPEYNGDTVSSHAMVRLRYASYLHKHTGIPILVTGGSVYGEDKPESALMKEFLETTLNTPVKWTESNSRTTYENAQLTRKLLAEEKIDTILLVTQAIHMPRSQIVFENAVFTVIPAATGYHRSSDRPWYLKLLPSAHALAGNSDLMHELMGRLWYVIRY